jgi:hypothetical protein
MHPAREAEVPSSFVIGNGSKQKKWKYYINLIEYIVCASQSTYPQNCISKSVIILQPVLANFKATLF